MSHRTICRSHFLKCSKCQMAIPYGTTYVQEGNRNYHDDCAPDTGTSASSERRHEDDEERSMFDTDSSSSMDSGFDFGSSDSGSSDSGGGDFGGGDFGGGGGGGDA